MQITELSTWEGRSFPVTWSDLIPEGERVTQVSGVCFTDHGEIVLVSGDGEHWSLPGGHPEAGETWEQTLCREVEEEACAVVERCVCLGAQRVDDPIEPTPYYQVRFWARVRLEPFLPRFETTQRTSIASEVFVATLGWQTKKIAQAILDAALGAGRAS